MWFPCVLINRYTWKLLLIENWILGFYEFVSCWIFRMIRHARGELLPRHRQRRAIGDLLFRNAAFRRTPKIYIYRYLKVWTRVHARCWLSVCTRTGKNRVEGIFFCLLWFGRGPISRREIFKFVDQSSGLFSSANLAFDQGINFVGGQLREIALETFVILIIFMVNQNLLFKAWSVLIKLHLVLRLSEKKKSGAQ